MAQFSVLFFFLTRVKSDEEAGQLCRAASTWCVSVWLQSLTLLSPHDASEFACGWEERWENCTLILECFHPAVAAHSSWPTASHLANL